MANYTFGLCEAQPSRWKKCKKCGGEIHVSIPFRGLKGECDCGQK